MKSSHIVQQKSVVAQRKCTMGDMDCKSKEPPQFKLESGKDAPNAVDMDNTVQRKNAELPEAFQAKMENALGTDLSNEKIVKDSKLAEDAGAKAMNMGGETHFAPGQFNLDSKEGQELAAHEFAHQKQKEDGLVKQTGEVNGMALNDDPALEKDADNKAAKAVNGEVAHSGVLTSGGSAGPVQAYMESEIDGKPGKVSKDLSLAAPMEGDKHTVYAEAGKVDESNAKLKAVGAQIRLQETSETATVKNDKTSKTLKRVLPTNLVNGESGEDMTMYADCGRASSMVMGGFDRNAVYNKLDGTKTQANGKGDPAKMKYEIFTHVFETLKTDAKYKDDKRLQRYVNQFYKYRQQAWDMFDEIEAEADPKKKARLVKKQNTAWSRMMDQYHLLPKNTREEFDATIGINRFANPEIGQAYTTSSGGNPFPGRRDSTWNFHWGGVVMKSSDGKDNLTLENYAVGDWDAENNDWSFNMYGPAEERGQTFHDVMYDSKALGMKPTTMAVARNYNGSRRGS